MISPFRAPDGRPSAGRRRPVASPRHATGRPGLRSADRVQALVFRSGQVVLDEVDLVFKGAGGAAAGYR